MLHRRRHFKLTCGRELEVPRTIHSVVSMSLEHVLERSQKAPEMRGKPMHDLIRLNVITVHNYLTGYV